MLDAAVQIFSVNGYHETSMDAIAAQAAISKPMLYLYYGSKEELFGACLNRELTRFVDLEEPRTVQADPRGMRRAYLEELRSYLEGIRRACQEADIDYLLADTARSPGEVLTELLARRQGR